MKKNNLHKNSSKKANKDFVELSLLLKDTSYFNVENTVVVETNSDFITVKKIIKKKNKTILFKVTHTNLNTQLNLTGVSPYLLLYFDDQLSFKSATYSIKSGTGSFVIQTHYKNILLVELPLDLELNTIDSLNYTN